MPQGILPYKYEQEKADGGLTALAGLPLYLDLASVLNLGMSIAEHLHVKMQGWTDEQIVMSLILLNLAGGDSVDDLRLLEADEGFCKILRRVELARTSEKAATGDRETVAEGEAPSVPSPSAVFRYLSAFHDGRESSGKGKAVIPPLTNISPG